MYIISTNFISTLISDLRFGDLNSKQFAILFNLSIHHITHITKLRKYRRLYNINLFITSIVYKLNIKKSLLISITITIT